MTRLAEAILEHAMREPDRVAIVGDGTALDWGALVETIGALAPRLRNASGPERRPVAVRLDHGPAACLIDLALLEAGVPSVALPPFFTDDQAAHAIGAAGCVGVIDEALYVQGGRDVHFGLTAVDAAPAALPDGTAKVSFTSGSTGQPKGICLSADHLAEVADAVVRFVGREHAGRHLPLLPPGILLESVAGFYATLIAGGVYAALSQRAIGLADPFRPDFARAVEAVERDGITSLILVPEYLAGLVAELERSGTRLPRLTLVAVGGARIAPSLLERAVAVGLPVRQGYGLTECGSVVALETSEAAPRGSVGTSIGVNRIAIAEDGEILLEGPLFLGTIGSPHGDRPLRTGDIGHFDETGRLWIDGRKSSLIITSFGRNLAPEWVEAVLTEQPAIRQAMVRGEGEARLEALVVPAAPDADLARAVEDANAALPAYARIERWQAVPPFLPGNGMLTGNGRLRRSAIDAAYRPVAASRPFFERLVAETREAQARFAAIPQLQAGLSGRIGRNDYLAYLTQAYHHVRHTVPLMQEARMRLQHRPELVEALDDYINEERGHEEWILDDIRAAGGDAVAAARGDPAPATAAMVDHAYRTIREENPAAFFGMVYVLEGTSIAMASAGASAVRASLGLPADAFRYLTSHGALDQQHMRFFEQLMNRIEDTADQEAIIAMARAMFGLFGGVFQSIDLEADRAAA